MTESQLSELRREFPIVQDRIYFDHASNGPLPNAALAASAEYMARRNRDADIPYAECEAVTAEARRLAADLMHVSPEEVAFTSNTSSGIIIAIGTIDWQPGDNLVMLKDAFPANSYPYHYLLPQVERRCVTSTELARGPDCVFRLIDRKTRCVALEWVHFLSGVRADIQAIGEFCRPLGVRFIVDAIQGLGVVDQDFSATGADFAAASAAKWLFGPHGIALLYVNRTSLPKLKPYNLGWLSARWVEFNDILSEKPLKSDASRYEAGTKNYPGIFALRACLELLARVGQPAIEQHVRHLNDLLRKGLTQSGFKVITPEEPRRSAGIITCVRPDADMAALHQRLRQAQMHCSLRENHLRIAPHCYNTEAEVTRFLEVLTRP
jgi:selenocysteine lyase/cysteine desulfurase